MVRVASSLAWLLPESFWKLVNPATQRASTLRRQRAVMSMALPGSRHLLTIRRSWLRKKGISSVDLTVALHTHYGQKFGQALHQPAISCNQFVWTQPFLSYGTGRTFVEEQAT